MLLQSYSTDAHHINRRSLDDSPEIPGKGANETVIFREFHSERNPTRF